MVAKGAQMEAKGTPRTLKASQNPPKDIPKHPKEHLKPSIPFERGIKNTIFKSLMPLSSGIDGFR
jgi:hypothetical protein